MTYAEKLKDPRWQKKRLSILNRDNWCCKLCNDTETTLHIHHIKYIPKLEPWAYEDNLLITYCEHCHSIVEYLKSHVTHVVKKTTNDHGLYFLAASATDKLDDSNSFMFFFFRKESGLEFIVQMMENSINHLSNYFKK